MVEMVVVVAGDGVLAGDGVRSACSYWSACSLGEGMLVLDAGRRCL